MVSNQSPLMSSLSLEIAKKRGRLLGLWSSIRQDLNQGCKSGSLKAVRFSMRAKIRKNLPPKLEFQLL